VCVCCLGFGGSHFLGLGVPVLANIIGECFPKFSDALHDFGALDLGVSIKSSLKVGLDVLANTLAEEDVSGDALGLGDLLVAVRLVGSGRLGGLGLLLGWFVGLGGIGVLVGHQSGHLLLKNLNALGKKVDGHRHCSSSCCVVVGCLMEE
tara:strand:+ start:2126 stop:2575 length:450 start_codon:yes stop_codon:yes gene_type:complete